MSFTVTVTNSTVNTITTAFSSDRSKYVKSAYYQSRYEIRENITNGTIVQPISPNNTTINILNQSFIINNYIYSSYIGVNPRLYSLIYKFGNNYGVTVWGDIRGSSSLYIINPFTFTQNSTTYTVTFRNIAIQTTGISGVIYNQTSTNITLPSALINQSLNTPTAIFTITSSAYNKVYWTITTAIATTDTVTLQLFEVSTSTPSDYDANATWTTPITSSTPIPNVTNPYIPSYSFKPGYYYYYQINVDASNGGTYVRSTVFLYPIPFYQLLDSGPGTVNFTIQSPLSLNKTSKTTATYYQLLTSKTSQSPLTIFKDYNSTGSSFQTLILQPNTTASYSLERGWNALYLGKGKSCIVLAADATNKYYVLSCSDLARDGIVINGPGTISGTSIINTPFVLLTSSQGQKYTINLNRLKVGSMIIIKNVSTVTHAVVTNPSISLIEISGQSGFTIPANNTFIIGIGSSDGSETGTKNTFFIAVSNFTITNGAFTASDIKNVLSLITSSPTPLLTLGKGINIITSAANTVVQLPALTSQDNGSIIIVKDGYGSFANGITIIPPAGYLIDNQTSNLVLNAAWGAAWFMYSSIDIISTIAGTGVAGYFGENVQATTAQINNPYGVALDSLGNIYIADTGNNRIRKVDTFGIITTFAGGGTLLGDNGPAISANLKNLYNITVDSFRKFLYIADAGNRRIRKVDLSTNIITTIAGTGTEGSSGDGGPATSAQLTIPTGVAIDSSRNILYIADIGNCSIRQVDMSLNPPIITRIAGSGAGFAGSSGDGGPAISALLKVPYGITVDSSNNILYIADTGNNRIRKVVLSTNIITTIAGNGTRGNTGDGGPATSAQLNNPIDVAVDSSRNILYIADTNNNIIRKVDLSTNIITTIAGTGTAGSSGDGGPATSVPLYNPNSVKVDSSGNVYISNSGNNRIRRITPNNYYLINYCTTN